MIKNIIEAPLNINKDSTTDIYRLDYSSTNGQIKEYSLWGWLKYTNDTKLLNNILAIYTLKQSNLQRQFLGIEKNKDHPDCPYSQDMIRINPSLIFKKQVRDNPNCFNVTNRNFQYYEQDTEILYMNFERSLDEQNFSLNFYIQQSLNENKKAVMVMDGFESLKFIDNSWIYFAVSINYKDQEIGLFIEDFNKEQSFQSYKKLQIKSESFYLKPIFEVDILSKKQNSYFQKNGVFNGTISFLSFTDLYVENIQDLWLLNMTNNQLDYQGILYESFFDIKQKSEMILNSGKFPGKYHIANNFDVLYEKSNETYGVQIYESSIFNLGNFDFDQVSQTHSFMFYFDLKLNEYQKDFYLLRRLEDQKAGYLEIKFIVEGDGFKIQLKLTGNGDIVQWLSPFIISKNIRIKFFIGVSLSIASSLKLIYLDDQDQHIIKTLSNNFWYNFMPGQLKLFDNQQDKNKQLDDKKILQVYRFIVINQTSSAIFTRMIHNSKNQDIKKNFENCKFILSGYQESQGCLLCNNTVANLQKQCLIHCPINHINFQNGTCLKCNQLECQDYPRTVFNIKQYDDDSFILEPTRVIKSDLNSTYENLFMVYIDDKKKNQKEFNYKISVVEDQKIRFDFKFYQNLQSSQMHIHGQDPYISSIYDINRNLVSRKINPITLENICYVSKAKNIFQKILASINLFMFFSIFLVLFFFQCLKSLQKKIDIKILWKMLFNWYMQLQLITFFTILGTNLPCCLFKYLDLFYDTFVTWNYILRPSLNMTYNSNSAFVEKLREKTPIQRQFILEGVKPYFLHNVGIIFIIQVTVIGIFLITLLIRKFNKKKSLFLKKLIEKFRFNIILLVNLLFIIHTTIFSAITIRQTDFSHFYFIMNFLISIVYILLTIFCLFFIAIAIMVPRYNKETLKKKYPIVLIGYKQRQKPNIFELYLFIFYLIIALSIGFLFDQIIAQNIIIVFCLFILIVITFLNQPYQYSIQQKAQIISYCFMIFAFIFLFIMSVNESNGCTYCGDREFSFCFLITFSLFFAQTTHFISMIILITRQLNNKVNNNNSFIVDQNFKVSTPKKIKAKSLQKKESSNENLLMSERDLEKQQNIEQIVSKQESINELIENLKKETIKSFNEDQEIQLKIDEVTNKTFSSEDLESEMFQENLHDLEDTIDLYKDSDIFKKQNQFNQ